MQYSVEMDDKSCRVEDCGRPVKVLKEQLCGLHYARLRRHGDPLAWKKPTRPICSVADCDVRAFGLGLCQRHYARQRRYGTTELPARPTVCVVDGCDRAPDAHSLCDRHYRRVRKGTDGARLCLRCGVPLDVNQHRRKFCSTECRSQSQAIKARDEHRAKWLKQYGLTVDEFDSMLATQGGGCAICHTGEPGGRGTWHVDHCHDSGRVRGLLCRGCNIGLGQFKDNPLLLEAAVRYLSAPLVDYTP